MEEPEGELESVRRFSSRAGEYARHRPAYAEEALDRLETHGYLEMGTRVADVGAGTGIFTEQLIGRGCEVWAVEPNGAMRSIAETALDDRHQFHSVTGDASDIPLDDDSVELVTAAQAFHWFDREAAREEFLRILEPPERVALVWNIRDRTGSAFMEALEDVLDEHGVDYQEVVDRYEDQTDGLEAFFGGTESEDAFRHRSFDYVQTLGLQGLFGLVTSFSYMPRPGTDDFDACVAALQELFEEYAEDGSVDVRYDTELYFGRIATA